MKVLVLIILCMLLLLITIFAINIIHKNKCKECGANKKHTYSPNNKTGHYQYVGQYCPNCESDLIKELERGI